MLTEIRTYKGIVYFKTVLDVHRTVSATYKDGIIISVNASLLLEPLMREFEGSKIVSALISSGYGLKIPFTIPTDRPITETIFQPTGKDLEAIAQLVKATGIV